MARTDNLTNFLTDVSTAIKTKKGDNTPIKASNFDTEIANLPSGGGDISDYFNSERTVNTTSAVTSGHWIYLVKKLPPITAIPTQCASFFTQYNGEELDLTRVPNTIEITQASNMFNGCKFKKLDLSNLNFNKLINGYAMFSGCTNLEELNLGNNTFSLAQNMKQMFQANYLLKNVPIKNFNYSSVTALSQFLYDCRVMENDIEINAPICEDFGSAFYQCRKVKNIKVSSNVVKSIYGMCTGCSELETLNMGEMNLSGITASSSSYSINNFLQNCPALKNLTFGTGFGEGFSSTLNANYVQAKINLSNCSSLTKESVLDVFNKVVDLTGKNTQQIALPSNVKALLADEEIAIATNKNWTVA